MVYFYFFSNSRNMDSVQHLLNMTKLIEIRSKQLKNLIWILFLIHVQKQFGVFLLVFTVWTFWNQTRIPKKIVSTHMCCFIYRQQQQQWFIDIIDQPTDRLSRNLPLNSVPLLSSCLVYGNLTGVHLESLTAKKFSF